MNSTIIKFGEREIEFHFGLGFLGELVDSFDLSIAEIGEKATANPHKYEPIIMYCSAVYALNRKGIKPDFTQYDFVDWIEEAGGLFSEPCQTFNKAFADSMHKDVPVQEQTDKKKAKK